MRGALVVVVTPCDCELAAVSSFSGPLDSCAAGAFEAEGGFLSGSDGFEPALVGAFLSVPTSGRTAAFLADGAVAATGFEADEAPDDVIADFAAAFSGGLADAVAAAVLVAAVLVAAVLVAAVLVAVLFAAAVLAAAVLLGVTLVPVVFVAAAFLVAAVCFAGFAGDFFDDPATGADDELLAATVFFATAMADPDLDTALTAAPEATRAATFFVADFVADFVAARAAGFATALDVTVFRAEARAALTRRSCPVRKVPQRCPSSRAHHRSESTPRAKVGDHSSSLRRQIRNSRGPRFLPWRTNFVPGLLRIAHCGARFRCGAECAP